jgi:hypothetical protein
MSRHRRTSRPNVRTQRQEFSPGRSVRFRAARTLVATAPARARILAGDRPPRPEYGRSMRNVLLTPWFAVSLGIVLAASIAVVRPQAALTFPPGQSGSCPTANCAVGGPPAVAPPMPDIRSAAKLHIAEKGYIRPRLSAIRVYYAVLPGQHDGFTAAIVIIAPKTLGNWTLRFVLPHAQVGAVMWATWAPQGRDGVVMAGSPLPWPRSGAGQARVVVFGTGTPAWPRGCVVDDARCVFRPLEADTGSPHSAGRAGHDGGR